MKKLIFLPLICIIALVGWSCDNSSGPDGEVKEASAQKKFVWNAMNYWYYWQKEVPKLADDRSYFDNDRAFQGYLNSFANADSVFQDLRYRRGDVDEFSFFIDNYEKFTQSQKGVSQSFGYEYGLLCLSRPCSDLLGYVQYIVPDTPADKAGLQRGDLFTKIDGTPLTNRNYRDLLSNRTNYELSLAQIADSTLSETDETLDLQAETIQENPIFQTEVIDTSAVKIGYLVFNSFLYNYNDELNDAFGMFKNKNIDELVVDLRYNGGGALVTSATLAGMISGQDTTDVFQALIYNKKRSDENTVFPIFNVVPTYDDEGNFDAFTPMNQLSLSKVYVLTGFGTASASEALINGLKPYMDVIVIGDQTVGKDEGSITLYDAPPTYNTESLDNINPNHKQAIQPIVFKIINSNGQNYPDGFTPDYKVDETDYLDQLSPLGDPNEPLLAKAIEVITGNPMKKRRKKALFPTKMFKDSRDLRLHGKEMYQLNTESNTP